MAQEIHLLQVDILDVTRQLYSGACLRVVAPAALGEVGILPGHAPLLTRLRTGEIRLLMPEGNTGFYFVSGGFMEVSNSTVTVLADQMLRSEEIDRNAALEARQRAEETLRTSHLFMERDAAQLALAEALVKLRILEHAALVQGKRAL